MKKNKTISLETTKYTHYTKQNNRLHVFLINFLYLSIFEHVTYDLFKILY